MFQWIQCKFRYLRAVVSKVIKSHELIMKHIFVFSIQAVLATPQSSPQIASYPSYSSSFLSPPFSAASQNSNGIPSIQPRKNCYVLPPVDTDQPTEVFTGPNVADSSDHNIALGDSMVLTEESAHLFEFFTSSGTETSSSGGLRKTLEEENDFSEFPNWKSWRPSRNVGRGGDDWRWEMDASKRYFVSQYLRVWLA